MEPQVVKHLQFGLILALLFADVANVEGQIAIIRNPVGPRGAEFRITAVDVHADIKNQVATVQIAQTFLNTSHASCALP